MTSQIRKSLITGAIFTSLLGVLFHSAYNLTGSNPLLAWLFPVNESTWEHLKLLYYPALLWTLLNYFWVGKDLPSYLGANANGILYGLLAIIVLFYSYSGVLGYSIVVIDVCVFFISVILCYYLIYKTLTRPKDPCPGSIEPEQDTFPSNGVGILFLLVVTILFIVFTYYPPHIKLFLDVPSGTYGIKSA